MRKYTLVLDNLLEGSRNLIHNEEMGYGGVLTIETPIYDNFPYSFYVVVTNAVGALESRPKRNLISKRSVGFLEPRVYTYVYVRNTGCKWLKTNILVLEWRVRQLNQYHTSFHSYS